jgi:hypothetical protein
MRPSADHHRHGRIAQRAIGLPDSHAHELADVADLLEGHNERDYFSRVLVSCPLISLSNSV